MTSPLRRRVAIPVAILVAAAGGCLLLAPQAPPSAARLEPSRRALRHAYVHGTHHPPKGDVIRYFAFDEDREATLRAALPCDGPKQVRWWRDIDYQQKGLCGGAKCFFRSLCDPRMGYLVQAGDKDGSYDFAKELEAEYGIKHFYAAPPFAAGWSFPRFVERLTREYVEFYEGAEDLVVQPTVTAPEGSAIVRCFGPRWKYLTGRIDQVLDGSDEAAKDRLIGDLQQTIELTKARPELINDFQLMIDPEGNAYQVDLDRVQNGEPSRRRREIFGDCLEDAITFVSALKNDDEDAKAELRKRQEERFVKIYNAEKLAKFGRH